MSPEADGGGAQAYFLAIEEAFIRLRGAPLLLSPADWRQARDWRQEGIPLSLILETLEEVFRQRRERGVKGGISSLRYCRRAVEEAWESARVLESSAHRQEAPAPDLAANLASLAAALPANLPRRERFQTQIQQLLGSPEEVEERLEEMDAEILAAVEAGLGNSARQRLEGQLARTLETLARRLPEGEVENARQRLWKQQLREHAGVPVISLFAVPQPS